MTHQGTSSLLALADDLRTKAEHVTEYWDHKRAAETMRNAAEALERLAPLEPDAEVSLSEN